MIIALKHRFLLETSDNVDEFKDKQAIIFLLETMDNHRCGTAAQRTWASRVRQARKFAPIRSNMDGERAVQTRGRKRI